jgi:hypothetical protein
MYNAYLNFSIEIIPKWIKQLFELLAKQFQISQNVYFAPINGQAPNSIWST